MSSRAIDLGPKKAAYVGAGIPDYWVVDAYKGGVWTCSDPADGVYRTERFVPVGEMLDVPVLGESLDTSAIFPPAPAACPCVQRLRRRLFGSAAPAKPFQAVLQTPKFPP